MSVTQHLHQLLTDRLSQHRILVWYDGERAFGDFVDGFQAANCHVVSAVGSRLRARREAEAIYRRLVRSEDLAEARSQLLIYLPFRREEDEAREKDSFEVFAVVGDTFGDDASEQLASLARQAMPDLVEQIDRLFRHGRPTLAVLGRLQQTPDYPLVTQVFGAHSPVEVAVRILGEPDVLDAIRALPGAGEEVAQLLAGELGVPQQRDTDWETRRTALARYVLFSEFALDLALDPGQALPDALANLPRAGQRHRERIFRIAERLRDSASYREIYLDLATDVERDLKLAAYFEEAGAHPLPLGRRDTFAFEERQHLQQFNDSVLQDDLAHARQILAERRHSIWRSLPERSQIWNVAERCLSLLETVAEIEDGWQGQTSSVAAMVAAYTQPQGWHRLDRCQRLMEQSVAECTDYAAIEAVIARCRTRYRQQIDAMQERFLFLVADQGWPPEDIEHQTELFDRYVAPALAAREKVVYILTDSLRYEMANDLAQTLAELGEAEIRPVTATLPTVTQVGMAALLPGAHGALALRTAGDEVVPAIGERRLSNLTERMAYLAERYGDRLAAVEISEFLSLPSQQRREAKLGQADLIVLRDSRIDNLGENVPLREVRKHLTGLLGDLKVAISQLAKLGCSYFVLVTDHGHVLLSEIRPGDVHRQTPDGQWRLQKRRSQLGRQLNERGSSYIFNAAHVGIQSDEPTFIVPTGFGVYSSGSGYFHGGLSLQEAVLPCILLRTQAPPREQLGEEVQIRYRRDSFTSRVIGLKIWFNSLFNEHIQVRVEAFGGSGAKARLVGEAADCAARDETTHAITLVRSQETEVPLLLDPDFQGDKIEIRATDPETGVIHDRLSLTNAMVL